MPGFSTILRRVQPNGSPSASAPSTSEMPKCVFNWAWHRADWFNPNLLNVGQEGVVCSHALRGGDWVWFAQSLSAAGRLLTGLPARSPPPLRGVAEERPALPKVGVPSSLFPLCRGKERLVPFSVTRKSDDRVVIAVDPHKASWTAAAVDGSLQPVATVR